MPPAGDPPAGDPPRKIRRKSTTPQARPDQQLAERERAITPGEEAAFATIEGEMGGRLRLVAALSGAQLDQATQYILGMIADPRNDRLSLAKVCALGNVSLARLIKLFRDATLAKSQMVAIARVAEKLPDVAAAIMDDAVPGRRTCGRCLGAMTIAKPTDDDPGATAECPNCHGLGEVEFRPELETQKVALQIGGLLEKGGQKITTIVASQNLNAGTDTGSYDKLVAGLDAIIYGQGRDRLRRPDAGGGDGVIEGESSDV